MNIQKFAITKYFLDPEQSVFLNTYYFFAFPWYLIPGSLMFFYFYQQHFQVSTNFISPLNRPFKGTLCKMLIFQGEENGTTMNQKIILVNNKNKLEAKLDNYIRILCTNNVHFYDLCIDFYSRSAPPLQFLENLALKS